MRHTSIAALVLVVAFFAIPAYAACPTEVVFGCYIPGSSGGPGWYVANTGAGTGVAALGGAVGVQATAADTDGAGVWGFSDAETGDGTGVRGSAASTNGGFGVQGFGVTGVQGNGDSLGVGGNSTETGSTGLYGVSTGNGGNGVIGEANTGSVAFGVWGMSTSGYAGYFSGKVTVDDDLDVTGTLTRGAGAFKIDHSLDPANKYLVHSFVESPDMMNVYNGLAVLDSKGKATVQLPKWFDALNKHTRYQLTAIGAPCPSL